MFAAKAGAPTSLDFPVRIGTAFVTTMPFNIRKPFVRRQTDQPVIEETGSATTPQYDAEGKAIPTTNLDDTAISSSVDQLKKFKKTHKWDYNLDYETIVCTPRRLIC